MQFVNTGNTGILGSAVQNLISLPGAFFVYNTLYAMGVLTLMVIFYFIFRNKKAVVAAVIVVFYIRYFLGSDAPLELIPAIILIALVGYGLGIFTMFRMGLLAYISGGIFLEAVEFTAMSLDTSNRSEEHTSELQSL